MKDQTTLVSFFYRSYVPSEARGTNSGFSAALFIYLRHLVHFHGLDGHNSNLNYKYTKICTDIRWKIIVVMSAERIGLTPRVGMKFKPLEHIDWPATERLTDFFKSRK